MSVPSSGALLLLFPLPGASFLTADSFDCVLLLLVFQTPHHATPQEASSPTLFEEAFPLLSQSLSVLSRQLIQLLWGTTRSLCDIFFHTCSRRDLSTEVRDLACLIHRLLSGDQNNAEHTTTLWQLSKLVKERLLHARPGEITSKRGDKIMGSGNNDQRADVVDCWRCG